MPLSQDKRPLKVDTPLGKDVMLLQHFNGEEAISELFHFRLELLAENQTDVSFDKLLGQKITLTILLPKGERHISGICNRIAQGGRDANLTRYHVEIVPQFWLLTRRVQSRIFQHETVVEILKKVLKGLDVAFELQGSFPKRDYCVQYRESDFAFASRLMEEEGIFYFFKHAADGHKLVLANASSSHADVPGDAKAIYEEV
jgi:type VI secretion system secreted protein VgrG